VWIRTARGIRSYADVRVPWDSAHQKLEVDTLRSWRPSDQRWTASGTTGIVETIPYALSHAPGYSHIRETMLLTDGVELPCVLELRYRISDREAFAGGMEGLYAMPHDDPCLISEVELGAPAGASLEVQSHNVASPITINDQASGLELRRFRAEAVEPRPWPHTSAAGLPHVVWSTWSGEEARANEIMRRFDAAASLEDSGLKAARDAVKSARSEIERAEGLAAWVGQSTRLVRYDRQWFPAPRPAQRSWETAFAHALDRCALAAAALRDAGFSAGLAFKRPLGPRQPPGPATTAGLEGPLLWVAGDGFEALYDPADSALAVADPALADGRVWRLGELPRATSEAPAPGALLRLDLAWNEEEGWQGTGMLEARGALSPYSRMQGLAAGRAEQVLRAIADAVLPGFEPSGANFESFSPGLVRAGFAGTLAAGERDPLDRLSLRLGDPAPQLNDPLHAAAPLHLSARGSAVHLPAAFSVAVELHLDPGTLEIVELPAARELANTVGSCRVTTEKGPEEIVLRHQLQLSTASVGSAQWPELRALLLAWTSPRNTTIILR
jgi:hypothetical protein